MTVSLRDVNVPSPGLENRENLLCSTRFTHTMSTIHLAGLQNYTRVLPRSFMGTRLVTPSTCVWIPCPFLFLQRHHQNCVHWGTMSAMNEHKEDIQGAGVMWRRSPSLLWGTISKVSHSGETTKQLAPHRSPPPPHPPPCLLKKCKAR